MHCLPRRNPHFTVQAGSFLKIQKARHVKITIRNNSALYSLQGERFVFQKCLPATFQTWLFCEDF